MNKLLITLILVTSSFISFGQNTDGDNLFDGTFLHEIRFEGADTLKFVNTKKYQQLKMIVDGNEIDSIGFKRKGNISQYSNPNKKAIKVKTNKYVKGKEYDGIKEFTLHMNYQDPSMLREKLTYDICAEMGLFSLRTSFAKVYINGDYWGLYTIVEGKDEMYKQVFDNRDMDAIESLDFGVMCFISNNPSDYDYENNGGSPTYQLENGDASTAWPRFATMIDKANNTPNNIYIDTVPKYLNIKDFFVYQAINVYLMNMDSYIGLKGNQIYVYDTITKIWQVTPWDFNASFGLWNINNSQASTYEMIPSAISTECIAKKLTEISELKKYYLDAMCQLNNIVGDTTAFFNRIDMWKAQIQQAVYNDTRKHITNTDFDSSTEYGFISLFGENIPSLKTFVSQRFNVIKQGLLDENYDCSSTTGILDNFEKVSALKLYPNPASDELCIGLPLNYSGKFEIQILNTFGQLIITENSINKIDLSSFSTGVYFVHLRINEDVYTAKFVKQ